VNLEKQFLFKVYTLPFCPSVINFAEINKTYGMSQNCFVEIKRDPEKFEKNNMASALGSLNIPSNCIAVSLNLAKK
jgi:hypothetical protein